MKITTGSFTKKTGIWLTEDELDRLKDAYTNDGGKTPFYHWLMDSGELAKLVKKGVSESRAGRLAERERMHKKLDELEKECDKLRAALDEELEWRPAENMGTSMSQDDYEDLARTSFTRVMTDNEARSFLERELGFPAKATIILHEVSVFEADKYHRYRMAETYTRKSLYASSDMVYIHFASKGFTYEYINGELYFYNS